MAKDKWRRPGQNYVIDVAGLEVTCKPITRGDRMNLSNSSQKIGSGSDSLDAFYKELQQYVVSVEGIEGTITEIFDHQNHSIMLELFQGILGAADLTETEVKNSASLPDTSVAEPSRE